MHLCLCEDVRYPATLELELQKPCGYWELNLSPLERAATAINHMDFKLGIIVAVLHPPPRVSQHLPAYHWNSCVSLGSSGFLITLVDPSLIPSSDLTIKVSSLIPGRVWHKLISPVWGWQAYHACPLIHLLALRLLCSLVSLLPVCVNQWCGPGYSRTLYTVGTSSTNTRPGPSSSTLASIKDESDPDGYSSVC